MLTYSLVKNCKVCLYNYVGRICDCEKNSYRGFRIWTRVGHAYASRHGVTLNARTPQELHRVIDLHEEDRLNHFMRGGK